MCDMRIKVRFSFILYLLIVALLSSPIAAFSALIALSVHEAGHFLAGRMMGEQFRSMELTPFGGIIRYTSGTSSKKGIRGIIIAAAGPAANYMVLLILCHESLQIYSECRLAKMLFVANASMLLLNLLPAMPLDGGRIVLSAGFYCFNTVILISALCCLGYITGILMILFAAYGLVLYRVLNCSLVIVGIYLIVHAHYSKIHLMYENSYAVIQDRQQHTLNIRPITLYEVNPDIKLHELLPAIFKAESSAFMFEDRSGIHCIFECDLLSALLESPSITIQEAQKTRTVSEFHEELKG